VAIPDPHYGQNGSFRKVSAIDALAYCGVLASALNAEFLDGRIKASSRLP
jgi:hypothetical protein